MILWAIFLLSFSSLSFEILLARIFSITQWNHLSFMVISIALFGFAASGTLVCIFDTRKPGWGKNITESHHLYGLILLFTVLTLAALFFLSRIPFDYFRLPFEPVQAFYLFILYLTLSLPFFIAGLVTLSGYAAIPEKSGYVYFAGMAGSACGAAFPALVLDVMGEAGTMVAIAILPQVLPVIHSINDIWVKKRAAGTSLEKHPKRPVFGIIGLSIAVLTIYFTFSKEEGMVSIIPSPYKALSQLLKFPDTRISTSSTGIRGRIDIVKSPYIRYAPGLSLKFDGNLPGQRSAFRDGDHPITLYSADKNDPLPFPQFSLPYAGYILSPEPDRVLIIEQGGGSAIPCAMSSKAKKIVIVQQHPHLAKIIMEHYRLPVASENPRTFIARTRLAFDVIHLDNWGSSLIGADSLSQDYLLTLEAFEHYIARLSPRGVLIISRRLRLPPADTIRVWSTAYESLKRHGIREPEKHIAILRNWDTFTLLVSVKPIEAKPLLTEFATRFNFDLVYSYPMLHELANRFNRFEAPYHAQAVSELSSAYRTGASKNFHRAYIFDAKPQSDDRPFPDRFFKWSNIKSIYTATGSRFYALFMSGEIIVAVVFIEAVAVSALLLILPLVFLPRQKKKAGTAHRLYFFSLGAGFMFLELFFINAFTLLFADPVISFTVVVTSILIFSGIGGIWSQHASIAKIRIALGALVGILIALFLMMDDLIHYMIGFQSFYRFFFAVCLLFPAGIIAGLPFPSGMRLLLETPRHRAYAWAANGCASVIAAIVSIQLAISFGITTILVFSGIFYFISLTCILTETGQRQQFSVRS
ncbi:MAG: hypothetical protein V1714_05975 [Pseudomonadota bacterium]